jgi:protein-tyrosine-phosphatase
VTTNVLFLCPHSAGKSVLAATYFRAAAARLGLDAGADVAGTDPDDIIMPNVRTAIEAQGLSITDTPRKVSTADVERADIVVSIGCDRSHVPAEAIIEWDVPLLSDDLNASMNAIHDHAEALAATLHTGR